MLIDNHVIASKYVGLVSVFDGMINLTIDTSKNFDRSRLDNNVKDDNDPNFAQNCTEKSLAHYQQ